MTDSQSQPLVSIVMGSPSDLRVMQAASDTLNAFGIVHEIDIVSAHRTPAKLNAYAAGLLVRGIAVVIAGAGGAAHLPGMIAAQTVVPVIGVPVAATKLDGMDSLLSIVQMPGGIPVATVAIDNAENAALLAAQIIGWQQPRSASACSRTAHAGRQGHAAAAEVGAWCGRKGSERAAVEPVPRPALAARGVGLDWWRDGPTDLHHRARRRHQALRRYRVAPPCCARDRGRAPVPA